MEDSDKACEMASTIQDQQPFPSSTQRKAKRVKRKLSDTVTYEDLVKDWTQCCYLIPRKLKLCNMQRLKDSRYCGAHIEQETSEAVRSRVEARVPCPLDPSHSIYAKDLQRHIKICNATKYQHELEQLPCYRENCNSGESELSEVNKEESEELDDEKFVLQLLKKIEAMWREVRVEPLPQTVEEQTAGDWLGDRIRGALGKGEGKERSSFKHWKHIEQDVAIARQLMKYSLLSSSNMSISKEKDDKASNKSEKSARDLDNAEKEGEKEVEREVVDRVFIEYGAGKGLLGMSLNLVDPKAALLFLEKSGNRKKIDKLLAERDCRFQRFRLDIRHCFLPALPFVSDIIDSTATTINTAAVTVVAKHLCGVATDLAIRSLRHLARPDPPLPTRPAITCGLAIATCCHHACQYSDYVGRELLLDRFAVSREEFEVMKYWSAWATLDLPHLRRERDDRDSDRDGVREVDKEGERESRDSERRRENNHHKRKREGEEGDDDDNNTEEKEKEEEAEEAEEVEEEPPQHSMVNIDEKSKEVQRRYRVVVESLLSYEEMFETGRRIKRLLDFGRALYLKEVLQLRTTAVQQYCEESYSPEAFLLVGRD